MVDKNLKQLQGLLEPIQKNLVEINKKLSRHDKKFEKIDKKLGKIDERLSGIDDKLVEIDEKIIEIDEKIGEHTVAIVSMEDTIKIYGDMYQMNNDNAKKLEKRVNVLEDKEGVVPPQELKLASYGG